MFSFRYNNFTIIALFLFSLLACKEKNVITLPDSLHDQISIHDITDITATAVSAISEKLPGEISEYGHVWTIQPGIPVITDAHTTFKGTAFPDSAIIVSDLSALTLNTVYNVRAYIKTTSGIAYGNTAAFTTLPDYTQRLVRILRDSLSGRDFGYSFILTKNGKVVGEGYEGLQARKIEQSGEIPLTLNSGMQIASMTKTLTSIAFLQLTQQYNIKATDKILDYLPDYWIKGPNIQLITFADLMKHQSGITGLGENCLNGAFAENVWWGLNALIEKGIKTENHGSYCYQNANFGLFRILIPAILGYQFSDPVTDNTETIRIYEEYISTRIFEKAGVATEQPLNNDTVKPTFGYSYPYEQNSYGFNPGDFSASAGAYGFYLSASDASKIYSSVFATSDESILSARLKDTLLLNGYGSYSTITSQGKFYYHDGWWHSGLGSGIKPRGFRSIWIKGPDELTLVLFTNSLRNDDGLFPLRSDAYYDITSFVLWAFSRIHGEGTPKGRTDTFNFHDYLEHPEPH